MTQLPVSLRAIGFHYPITYIRLWDEKKEKSHPSQTTLFRKQAIHHEQLLPMQDSKRKSLLLGLFVECPYTPFK